MGYTIETVKHKEDADFIHNGKVYGLIGSIYENTGVGMTNAVITQNTFNTDTVMPDGPISASDMAFIAKVEASRDTGATVYLKRQNQILWGSDAPDRGSDCIPTLKSARIGEVYDNAVELDVCVFKGQRAENTGIHYTVTAYCFYDKEECIKPVIGMIAIDAAEDGHVVEKTFMLTDKEREALQQVLDKVEFRQYQFGNEVATIEEEEEREI